ncbi:hypothetical protein [uncultured Faecalibaculum sp.]|uniref:DUF7601 domain-containing protein n=1 Tax=uncultured Faecalibaculum sp. TaxID=1729681 RepID=UPI002613F7C8|nr:hypothetical protein [uncultured Faecalibaculum sp.]
MKNFKTKLFAAAIAAPLAMSGMSVFAEGDDEASITVTKDLTAPKGAEKLDATFTMTGTLTKINEQEATDAEKADTPSFSWTFNASKDSVTEKTDLATDTTVTYTATSDNLLDNKTYSHAGVYTYEFKENQSVTETLDLTKETVTFDNNTFTVNVYVVENETGGYEVKAATQATDTGKATSMTFANTYTRKGSTNPDDEDFDGMVIGNTVAGDLADKTKDFSYTLTLTDADSTVTPDVKKGNTVITPVNGVYTFVLKHGETVTVSGVSTGSTYSVTQNQVQPYTTTATYDTEEPIALPTINDVTRTVSGNVTAKKDIINYKNTYDNKTVPTGNIINNMPFLGLIAVALGGFIAYIALKRRQNA